MATIGIQSPRRALWCAVAVLLCCAPAAADAARNAAAGWCPALVVAATEPGLEPALLAPAGARYDVEVLGTIAVGRITLRYRSDAELPRRAAWAAAVPAGVELDGAVAIGPDGERFELADEASPEPARRGAAAPAKRDRRVASAKTAGRRAGRSTVGALELPTGETTIELTFHTDVRSSSGRFALTLPPVGGRCAAPDGRGGTRALAVPTDALILVRHDEPLEAVDSPSHDVLHDFLGDRTEVEPVTTDPLGERAIELRFALGRRDEPSLVGFSGPQLAGGEQDVVLVLAPAVDTAPDTVRPKEVLFVLDTSGSMKGSKIEQARLALAAALGMLRDGDRFNAIEFDSDVTTAFEQPALASPSAVDDAIDWLGGLPADGSTRLFPALSASLAQQAEPGFHRLLVLLTDGRVGDEAAATQFLDQALGEARFFVVGIGQDADAQAIERIAEHGRGAAAFATQPDQLAGALAQLFDEVSEPVAWNLAIDWGGAEVLSMQPSRLPDLYGSRPVAVRARVRGSLGGGVRIEAQTTDGARTFESRIADAPLPPTGRDAN